MVHYYDRRKRSIETPLGPVEITERKWNEGEDDEHWAYVQSLSADWPKCGESCNVPNGEVLAFLLEQFTVARTLVQEGYELNCQLDSENLLWVNYE